MNRTIIGMGNPLKGDDNIGNIIALMLGGVAAKTAPENHIPRDADEIILIDAVLFDAPVGTVREFSPDSMKDFSHSTHNLPLSMFQQLNPNAKIRIIAIQPKDIEFGEGMTREIADNISIIYAAAKKLIS